MTSRWAPKAQSVATGGLIAMVVMIPLVISRNGDDAFRLPKLLFFQAGTLLIAAVVAIAAIYDGSLRQRLLMFRPVVVIVTAAVGWGTIATLVSRKPVVSHDAPFTLFCYALFFVMVLVLPPRTLRSVAIAVGIPATITAIYAIAQFLKLQTPFIEYDGGGTRSQVIALLGNPNYVATFLVFPVVAMLATIVTFRRWFWLAIPVGLAMTAVVTTLTVTALAATGAAALAMLVTAPTRRSRMMIVAALIAALLATLAFPPARDRAIRLTENMNEGRYDLVSSFRIPAFSAATMMLRERPIFGAGPGVFAAEYMSYRLRVDERHPEWIRVDNPNFGEVHNDHLQLLAEAGVPAYLLFLALCVSVAALSFTDAKNTDDERCRFVRTFAFPFVVAFLVLALAQFPMQLAASASTALFLAATCFAWARAE